MRKLLLDETRKNIELFAYKQKLLCGIDMDINYDNLYVNKVRFSKPVKSFTFPDGIQGIGPHFVFGDPNLFLKQIVIPDSVKLISRMAFASLEGLQTVECGSGLKIIEYNAFIQCRSLKQFNFNGSLVEMGHGVFDGCNSLEGFNFGKELKKIPHKSFDNCYYLRNVDIPASVRYIDHIAFRKCINLETIIIRGKLDGYNKNVFEDCCNVKDVYISNANSRNDIMYIFDSIRLQSNRGVNLHIIEG